MPDDAAALPIQIDDLHKSYRDVDAVTGVSFAVQQHQILGLVGPNGAGKTTIIRAACGIHPPTSGQIRICGHDVTKSQVQAKRELAYVPDDPKLFSTLTVWEHLQFVAAAYRVQDRLEKVGEQLLKEFELTEKRTTMASALSRGMRQKLAICCAYLHEPSALFLDEPLTGLDPRGMRTMKASIRRHAERGAAVVISSHLLSLVEDMCSHLLILHRGRILYNGTLAGLRESSGEHRSDETLEDIFLRMTEGESAGESTEAQHA
ncbi:MAG: ABC transporter ATP-binding protein [Planctomycetes bacterium]|nr:ABC transporter ATP-binding protein [Planctomycetota bacterium]NOG53990.1 ABC transporter ATP-binding protein [Planctomycetota bacterium]